MPSILDPLVDRAAGIRKGTRWYQQAVASIADKISARRLMNQGKLNGRPSIGRLNMFFYDPKFKKTLPYYDTFPLVLPIENYPDGFLGINFHYLPMSLRLKLLDRVIDYSNNTKFDESTRLAVDYSKLKKINLIKPALKRYLAGRVKTQFRRVDADEFTVAVLLPIARWKKGTAAEVYKDSRSII
mgnify:CR=1 FL=1